MSASLPCREKRLCRRECVYPCWGLCGLPRWGSLDSGAVDCACVVVCMDFRLGLDSGVEIGADEIDKQI